MIGVEELHGHACTVQRARIVASESPYHPGDTALDFDPPAAQATMRCRIQRLDSVTITEMVGGGKAGTRVATDYLYLAYGDAPASLVDQGSTPSPESLHRIVDVLRPDGSLLDAGPFEIVRIVDMAGAGDVLKLELKRVQ
jgi:hypothetical protein